MSPNVSADLSFICILCFMHGQNQRTKQSSREQKHITKELVSFMCDNQSHFMNTGLGQLACEQRYLISP